MWNPEAGHVAATSSSLGQATVRRVRGERGEGAEEEAPLNPILSRTERRVIARMLDQIVELILNEFDLDLVPGTIWQEPEGSPRSRTSGRTPTPKADDPPVLRGQRREREQHPDLHPRHPWNVTEVWTRTCAAPTHLAPVQMSVDAVLGGTFVPLAELLGVEVGA